MLINRNIIIRYIKDHFEERDYKIRETEIQLNSPFKQDSKFHLGISLQYDKMGVFSDLKPPQVSGSFFKLVAMMNNMSVEQAKLYIIEKYLKYINENDIENFFKSTEKGNEKYLYKEIELPKTATPILKNGKPTSQYARMFQEFLNKKRNISDFIIEERQLMYCYDGPYKDYLICPFFNENKKVVYWVARNNMTGKYKNIGNVLSQGASGGIGYNIFTDSKTVVLVEGIFDALRIENNAGIALLRNNITDSQINSILLKGKDRIIVAMDNFVEDAPGRMGILDILKKIYVRIDKKQTKLMFFKWNNKFRKYKDFSRCPFDFKLEDIIDNSEKYDSMSYFKINLFSKLFS